ncbi:MAG: restriction endonuclease subunit S [Chloroflexi bacterium]|nr:restriction endonuclease subunit S [Chloroflexota bacterium]
MPLLNGPTEFGDAHPNCTLFTTDSQRQCEPGDLIFCVRGSTTGRMNWADRVYSLGRGVCAIRGETQLDTRFIRYCLDFSLEALLKLATGGTFPNLTKDTISEFEIPFPDVRRKIAAILSAYDDLIEVNQRRIRILQEMAQSLYREWFVRFRFPGHESARWVESEVGRVPEGWEVRKLGQVIELAYGKALTAENRRAGPAPVYGSSGVVGYHDEAMVQGPGIIVGRKGNVGSVHWSDTGFWPIDTVFYVQTNLPLPYVYYNFQTQNFLNNDAAVPGLNRNQAYLLPIVVPADPLLSRFGSMTMDVFAAIRNLRSRNANLRATRDLLLPRLISGEVEV